MVRQRHVTRVVFALLAPILLASCDSGGSNQYVAPVSPPSNLVATPAALYFSATGAANSKTVSVTDGSYPGPISVAAADCGTGASAIVTASPSTGNGPALTVTVTPRNPGFCHVSVADATGALVTVSVLVSSFNTSVTSLAFSGTGAAYAQTFTISYPGYGGTLTIGPGTCGTGPVRHRGERGVAHVAQRRLVVAVRLRASDEDAPPQPRSHRTHHALVLIGARANAVVDVRQHDLEAVFAREAVEQRGERDRVRTAGACDENALAGAPAHRAPDHGVQSAFRARAAHGATPASGRSPLRRAARVQR